MFHFQGSGKVTVLKIYVVDDEPDILHLTNIVLKKHGYDVHLFSSGVSMLERIDEAKPDLILLDMVMPVLNGIGVIKRLKENPETDSIPIIVFSALAKEDNIKAAKEAGADKYLRKPFVLDELVSTIKDLCGGF